MPDTHKPSDKQSGQVKQEWESFEDAVRHIINTHRDYFGLSSVEPNGRKVKANHRDFQMDVVAAVVEHNEAGDLPVHLRHVQLALGLGGGKIGFRQMAPSLANMPT